MRRYAIEHPRTATVTVADMQRAGDFLFTFRNSPDFADYVVRDLRDGHFYSVSLDAMGVEMTWEGQRA